MKRIGVALAAAAIATSSFAGITYRFKTTTEGAREHALSGIVKSETGKSRLEITSSDEMIFTAGSVILSSGGSVITVLDPASRTYYELDMEKYLQRTMGAQSPYVKVDIVNPHVSARENGPGGTLQGYPTRRTTLNTSFDLVPSFAGQKQMTIRMNLQSEIWLTDRLPSDAVNVVQSSRLHTGVEAIDKIIDSSASLRGFPLKQVTRSSVTVSGGTSQPGTSTTVVSDIRQGNVAPSEFVVPSGYTKTDDPLEAMLKKLGVR